MSLPLQPWVPGTGLGSGDTGPPADPAPPFCGRKRLSRSLGESWAEPRPAASSAFVHPLPTRGPHSGPGAWILGSQMI